MTTIIENDWNIYFQQASRCGWKEEHFNLVINYFLDNPDRIPYHASWDKKKTVRDLVSELVKSCPCFFESAREMWGIEYASNSVLPIRLQLVLLAMWDDLCSILNPVSSYDTALDPGAAELIGKRLLFGLVLDPDSDVGRCVLEFLPGKKGKLWDNAEEAAAAGHLHLVQSLCTGAMWQSRDGRRALRSSAVRAGRLKVLMWLCENMEIECDRQTANLACRFGQLRVLIWLHENGISCDVSPRSVYAEGLGMDRECLIFLYTKGILQDMHQVLRCTKTGFPFPPPRTSIILDGADQSAVSLPLTTEID